MLRGYGAPKSFLYWSRWLAIPLFTVYSKWRYAALARQVPCDLEDDAASGFTVAGIVGIDGSPPCGVSTTLDLPGLFEPTATLDPKSVTLAEMNAIIKDTLLLAKACWWGCLGRRCRGEVCQCRSTPTTSWQSWQAVPSSLEDSPPRHAAAQQPDDAVDDRQDLRLTRRAWVLMELAWPARRADNHL